MTSRREITDDCITFAVYGVSADAISLESLYKDLVEWFTSTGVALDKVSIHGAGFGGKPVGFAKAHSRLCNQGFSEIRSFTLFALLPDAQIPTVDWWATAYLDVDESSCFYIEARRSVATLEDDRFNGLITKCLAHLKPSYGIGYHRDHDRGPGFYAIGLNYGNPVATGEAYEEKLAISRWGDLAMVKEVYKQGILRDIYPHNYLSAPQLERRIGRQTLEAWILSDASRGVLTQLDDRMKLWKVQSSRIKSIRAELWPAGVIFDWKSHLDE